MDMDIAEFSYTNHKGRDSLRRVRPVRMWHGSTSWYPEPQWLLEAVDLDKGVVRDFAFAKIRNWRRSERKPRPKVVTLCGSTRFKKEFVEANFQETMKGHIVLSVGWFSHADGHVYSPTEAEKIALDELHLRKIEWGDESLILDCLWKQCSSCQEWYDLAENKVCNCPAGPRLEPYLGASTRREIRHTDSLGKPVRFWSLENEEVAEVLNKQAKERGEDDSL